MYDHDERSFDEMYRDEFGPISAYLPKRLDKYLYENYLLELPAWVGKRVRSLRIADICWREQQRHGTGAMHAGILKAYSA